MSSRAAGARTEEGLLIVVSAPSGAGKTSLCQRVVDFFPNLRHSVSFTTRAMRAGEQNGRDYHFVASQRFAEMVAAGAFAEWAEVHGNRYGTAHETLTGLRSAGHDVLLDIDFQGAAQLKQSCSDAVFIFILPPSEAELRRRLEGRGTDAPEVIARRLANARDEVREASWYDYVIVNDDLEEALGDFAAIIRAEKCRAGRVLPGMAALFTEG